MSVCSYMCTSTDRRECRSDLHNSIEGAAEERERGVQSHQTFLLENGMLYQPHATSTFRNSYIENSFRSHHHCIEIHVSCTSKCKVLYDMSIYKKIYLTSLYINALFIHVIYCTYHTMVHMIFIFILYSPL